LRQALLALTFRLASKDEQRETRVRAWPGHRYFQFEHTEQTGSEIYEMDFWQHLTASGHHTLKGLAPGLVSRFSELVTRGHSVADLLAHYSDEFGHLPVDVLRQLTQSNMLWQLWQRRRAQIVTAREEAGLPPLPDKIFEQANTPDQLDAIVRTARLAPRKVMDSEEAWLAVLQVGVELWARCIGLARKDGTVRCRARDLEAPGIEAFDGHINREDKLNALAPHRWLAVRRGEREGLLELKLTLPQDAFAEQLELVRDRLGPNAAERSTESLLEELILNDLPAWLVRLLDTEAQMQAIKAAADSLAGLLRTSPVQARLLGAIYLTRPRAPVGAVVTDRDGDLQAQRVIRAEGPWVERVLDFLREQGIQHVVLPTSTVHPESLAELEARLGEAKLQLVKIRPAALAGARQPLMDPPMRLSASLASAVVLARRALDPLREWSLVDPVSIGVAEYQNDLDADLLRAALRETVELCRLERRRGKRVHMGGPSTKGNPAMAKLNPLVKSLADLRPGMMIHGVVTNISHFGAFVNIGLPQEALVHISELSDSFVSNPNEVVSIGQQVTAHVLSVEPTRGRISLSLKTRRRPSDRRDERRPPGGKKPPGPRPEPDGEPMSKAEALANLEKLFKK
jgi:predicted RNA-binding protein with RPS1 domain